MQLCCLNKTKKKLFNCYRVFFVAPSLPPLSIPLSVIKHLFIYDRHLNDPGNKSQHINNVQRNNNNNIYTDSNETNDAV